MSAQTQRNLRVTDSSPSGQARIENTHIEYENFDREYISFSGYFGEIGPNIFAAAPELLEALEECASDLEAEIEARRGAVLERTMERDLATVARARAIIAKATGQ